MTECGNCTECCTLLEVRAIRKPRLVGCKFLSDGGCGIYTRRPAACKVFTCIWLEAGQRGETAFDLVDRPDFSHVVLGPTNVPERDTLYVHVDPKFPEAWKKGRVGEYIDLMRKRGKKIVIFIGDSQWRIIGEAALFGTEAEFEKLDARTA